MQQKTHTDFALPWPYPQRACEESVWLLENMMKLVVWNACTARINAMMEKQSK